MEDKERASRLEQSSVTAALEGLKALLILNGGASVAVLGFLATTMDKNENSPLNALLFQGMMRSLIAFAIGASLSVLTSLFAYLANQAYAANLRDGRNSWHIGERWNLIAIGSALLSLISFLMGVGLIWHSAPV